MRSARSSTTARSLPISLLFLLACENDAPQPLVTPTPALTAPPPPVAGPRTPDGGAGDDRDGSAGTDGGASGDGLTPDFVAWLDGHGYAGDDFARRDLVGAASFGGKRPGELPFRKRPVVFVHGNSDRALGGSYRGFAAARAAFQSAGYPDGALYGTTWGPADPAQASAQTHSAAYVSRTRRFLDAVLAYTGREELSVVAHSMGVTLARRAILGGSYTDERGRTVDLGPPLGDRVAVFVALAGANYGLSSCFYARGVAPTCGAETGLYPGTWTALGVVGVSRVLAAVNSSPHSEGRFVAAAWASHDEILGGGGLVWGQQTAVPPGADLTYELTDAAAGHFTVKDELGPWLVTVLDR